MTNARTTLWKRASTTMTALLLALGLVLTGCGGGGGGGSSPDVDPDDGTEKIKDVDKDEDGTVNSIKLSSGAVYTYAYEEDAADGEDAAWSKVTVENAAEDADLGPQIKELLEKLLAAVDEDAPAKTQAQAFALLSAASEETLSASVTVDDENNPVTFSITGTEDGLSCGIRVNFAADSEDGLFVEIWQQETSDETVSMVFSLNDDGTEVTGLKITDKNGLITVKIGDETDEEIISACEAIAALYPQAKTCAETLIKKAEKLYQEASEGVGNDPTPGPDVDAKGWVTKYLEAEIERQQAETPDKLELNLEKFDEYGNVTEMSMETTTVSGEKTDHWTERTVLTYTYDSQGIPTEADITATDEEDGTVTTATINFSWNQNGTPKKIIYTADDETDEELGLVSVETVTDFDSNGIPTTEVTIIKRDGFPDLREETTYNSEGLTEKISSIYYDGGTSAGASTSVYTYNDDNRVSCIETTHAIVASGETGNADIIIQYEYKPSGDLCKVTSQTKGQFSGLEEFLKELGLNFSKLIVYESYEYSNYEYIPETAKLEGQLLDDNDEVKYILKGVINEDGEMSDLQILPV